MKSAPTSMPNQLMRRIGVGTAVLIAVVGSLTVSPIRSSLASTLSSRQQSPTVAQIYRRAQHAATRPGMLYHATIHGQSVGGPIRTSTTQEQWINAQRNVAREKIRVTFTFTDPKTHRSGTSHFRQTTITTRQGAFSRASPPPRVQAVEPPLCYGPGLLAADVILGCPGPTTQSTTTVQSGWYAGHPAVVLVTKGTSYGEDESQSSTTRLYLDPASFLPIAGLTSGTLDIGKKYPLRAKAVYTHNFVAAASVARDFFEPVSIGYRDPAVTIGRQLDRLPSDFTAYWLGLRFPGRGALPPLVVSRLEPAGGPGYLFILHYTPAEHPYGAPVVSLQEFRATNRQVQSSNGPCHGKVKERLTLPAGSGAIYTVHGLHACAFFKGTIVMVDAPGVFGPTGSAHSPYATVAGLKTVLQSLRLRVRTGAAHA